MITSVKTKPTMSCPECGGKCQRFGKHRNRLRRFRSKCRKTYTEPHKRTLGTMSFLRTRLCWRCNCSWKATAFGALSASRAWSKHHYEGLGARWREVREGLRLIVNVPVKDVQCDEIWAFIRKLKATRQSTNPRPITPLATPTHSSRLNAARSWCLTCARSGIKQRQIPLWVRAATSSQRFQISTDGFGPYTTAIEDALEDRVDYGLIKKYNEAPNPEKRYSRPMYRMQGLGKPNPDKICTALSARTSPCGCPCAVSLG